MHFFTFFVKIFNFSKIILKNLISYSVVNQLIMIFKVKKSLFWAIVWKKGVILSQFFFEQKIDFIN